MRELFGDNHPERFWSLRGRRANPALWETAALEAAETELGSAVRGARDVADILVATLGEGQFGERHWRLGASRRSYYVLKPLLPHAVSARLRQAHSRLARRSFPLDWPWEDRYPRFLWEVLRLVLQAEGRDAASFTPLWPEGAQFALVLTHDVETGDGQRQMAAVADLEEGLGLRSSFNVVPERYPLDRGLLRHLQDRGFEIGVHGLHHDGHLFDSREEFGRRVVRINAHLRSMGASGFRSPLTHRHPAWMQELEADYDASFFDTDPFEPQPGGTMSLWPFFIGHLVELPYTLPQDFTLSDVVHRPAAPVWGAKLAAIRNWHGMALTLTHPDYLRRVDRWAAYRDFLETTCQLGGFWHALPRGVARWWRQRSAADDAGVPPATARLVHGEVRIVAGRTATAGAADR